MPAHLQAFASFAAAISAQPAHVGALVACAAVYTRYQQLSSAVATLERARKAAPEDPAVQLAYAKALNAHGMHALAPLVSSCASGCLVYIWSRTNEIDCIAQIAVQLGAAS